MIWHINFLSVQEIIPGFMTRESMRIIQVSLLVVRSRYYSVDSGKELNRSVFTVII